MLVNNFETKHTFIYESSKGDKITFETDAICLEDVLYLFERYLLGCGFNFNGHLEIVEDENFQAETE